MTDHYLERHSIGRQLFQGIRQTRMGRVYWPMC